MEVNVKKSGGLNNFEHNCMSRLYSYSSVIKILLQVFYYTHFLYVAFFILVALHGPIFWAFLLVPMVIFILEKLYGFSIWLRFSKKKSFTIAKVGLLPSKVTFKLASK